jgi:RNA polymerase sigma-70 factor (ECF subfamily)
VSAPEAAELERVLRDQWGRLLALLVAQYRRLDLAEDGLADAVEAAARTWPTQGVPANPPAWLLTAARRRVLDRLRAEAVHARRLPQLAVEASLTERAEHTMDPGSLVDPDAVHDEVLRLVLLCAHPSLPREHAAALTLRLVVGVSTEEIARLFLVPTPTMAARLTRARKKLAGAAFEVPTGPALTTRVGVVADVAYLAFTAGYAPGTGADVLRADVAAEAVRLVRVLRRALPAAYAGHRDRDALLALMLLQHSRRDARVSATGELVLLPDQDRARWDHRAIAEALGLLQPHLGAPGSTYLLQALIAAEHALAPRAEQTDWSRIVRHFDELLRLADSPVVRLNRAVAVAEADGPLAGLAALEGLVLSGHRLPAVRAELLARAGRTDEALDAFDEALSMCGNAAEAGHLARRREDLRRER